MGTNFFQKVLRNHLLFNVDKSVMKKYWKNQPLSDRRLVTSASSPVKNRAILFKKNDDRFPPFAVTIPLKRKSRLLGPLTFCILSISVRESSWKKNTPFTFFDLSKRPSSSMKTIHVIQKLHTWFQFCDYFLVWNKIGKIWLVMIRIAHFSEVFSGMV